MKGTVWNVFIIPRGLARPRDDHKGDSKHTRHTREWTVLLPSVSTVYTEGSHAINNTIDALYVLTPL